MSRFRLHSQLAIGVAAIALSCTLTSCGGDSHDGHPFDASADHMGVAADNGLTSAKDGYNFVTDTTSISPSQRVDFAFHINAPDGKTQTSFVDDQAKLMHLYVIRSDATGYQHLHPTMGAGDKAGMWSVPLRIDSSGSYRVYAGFIAKDASNVNHELVLSQPLTVPGNAANTPIPPASDTSTVDGYTLKLSGDPMAGMHGSMTITITKDGTPVTNLERYLDTFAHLTAFKTDDLAFIHMHPSDSGNAANGGPTLQFMTEFPIKAGYRVFVQFQTLGQLHTAAFTVDAK